MTGLVDHVFETLTIERSGHVVAEAWTIGAGELRGDQLAGFGRCLDDTWEDGLGVCWHGVSL